MEFLFVHLNVFLGGWAEEALLDGEAQKRPERPVVFGHSGGSSVQVENSCSFVPSSKPRRHVEFRFSRTHEREKQQISSCS